VVLVGRFVQLLQDGEEDLVDLYSLLLVEVLDDRQEQLAHDVAVELQLAVLLVVDLLHHLSDQPGCLLDVKPVDMQSCHVLFGNRLDFYQILIGYTFHSQFIRQCVVNYRVRVVDKHLL